jgi:hypothetical protein
MSGRKNSSSMNVIQIDGAAEAPGPKQMSRLFPPSPSSRRRWARGVNKHSDTDMTLVADDAEQGGHLAIV